MIAHLAAGALHLDKADEIFGTALDITAYSHNIAGGVASACITSIAQLCPILV